MQKKETEKKLTSRQIQAAQTKEKIYKTAFALMGKKGFNNISIEDISKKAGVSVGAFYYYYKSKNDILYEVYSRADDYFRIMITQLKTEHSLDRIVEYFQIYARYLMQSNIEFTKHLYSTENKFFLNKNRFMLTALQEIIKEGQEKGEITLDMQPKEIADYLFLVARGVIFDWCLQEGKYNVEDKIKELFKLQAMIYKAN